MGIGQTAFETDTWPTVSEPNGPTSEPRPVDNPPPTNDNLKLKW
ncbi:MAG: hypothetical protein JWN24_2240 [Phycisphaerales bacterium]|jgi:hypothetical protein|nr:hypothetical protein [Phycisphaerales bacterium]